MDHYGAHHGLDFDGTEGLIETAKLFSSQRRFDQSAEYLQAALRAAQIAGDTRTVMKVWDLLADSHCRGGRCDEALRSIRSFLSVADSLGCNIDRAQARFRLVQAWIAEPDSIPGFDPFVVIAEIDRLMEPLLEEPDPGHALRRGRLVAEVLTAKGQFPEAANEWSDAAAIAAAAGRRPEAFEFRANEARCRVNAEDIAGAERAYRTLLATIDDSGRPELTEWVVLAGVDHFLLKQDEAFWAEVESECCSRPAFDVRSYLDSCKNVFAQALSACRRAHFLTLRAFAAVDDEPEIARQWLEEAADLVSSDTDRPQVDAYVRGLVELCRGDLTAASGDREEAIRSYSASAVHLILAHATVLAHRAAERAADLHRNGVGAGGEAR